MELKIGILFAPRIQFRFLGNYKEIHSGKIYTGDYSIHLENERLLLSDLTGPKEELPLPLTFEPECYDKDMFELTDVTIGIQFHWERKEIQRFKGKLEIIREDDHLTAVNQLDIEDYLCSVISSEMSATSSPELLKAHAVVSRSWLLAQQEKAQELKQETSPYCSVLKNENEYICWFDREDHANFDVCADDHCQRYQGITKASTPAVYEAVEATRGEVLTYKGKVCDTRFSKCCGGITENFENVWEPVAHPYLNKRYDAPRQEQIPDLTREEEARKWINSFPAVFCNTTDKQILREVLNDYDLSTQQFFRWEIHYTQQEIAALLKKKLNIDFGQISDLQPLERGTSGRIIKLKIIGSRQSLVIGKELWIRRALSPTHLYSSAFIVDKEMQQGTVSGFCLKGAGWGHGVGLCQIGAAVMSTQGYSYQEILRHYFPHTQLKLYRTNE